MKNNHLFTLASLVLLSTSCKKDPPVSHRRLNIVLSDKLAVEYKGGNLRLPRTIKEICAVISADTVGCQKTYVLDPLIFRGDQESPFPLITIIQKGGAKRTTSPALIGKSIQKNFDELDIPKVFTRPVVANISSSEYITRLLSTSSKNDSILVFSTDGSLSKYFISSRSVPVFNDTEAFRKYILNVLCQNDKANFTVLYNPPVPPPPPPPQPVDSTKSEKKGVRKIVRRRPTITTSLSGPSGICDPVTHTLHEKVVDANGRIQRGDKVLVMNCKECGY